MKLKQDSKKTEQEKVEERREEVLAQGRKFKYPLQYTKHRVVINTILIAVVVVALLVVGGWFALYKIQMTDEVLYRVTRVLPVSVAEVDFESVKFADYLMLYRSSIVSVERQSGALENGGNENDLKARYKRIALTEAEKYAYATKLGRELNIEVTEEEIEKEFERHRQVGGLDRSKEGFLKILQDNFGLSEEEYKRILYLNLMEAKVEIKIDETANSVAAQVEAALGSNGGDYQAVAEALGEAVNYEETGGMVDSRNIDGGRATEAMKLEPGGQSGKFVSMNGDGYYFVKLVAKSETTVNFVSIKVPFTEFEKRFNELKETGKVREMIELPE